MVGPLRPDSTRPHFLSIPALRYPRAYGWLVFISSMDIIMTWIIIVKHEGAEANPIARAVIDTFGSTGMILFKFALMVLVIVICEIVGRSRDILGRRLAWAGVVISALPMLVSASLVISRITTYFAGES
jgi:mannitol-specific phosphotransferase system IIBC component